MAATTVCQDGVSNYMVFEEINFNNLVLNCITYKFIVQSMKQIVLVECGGRTAI